MQKSKPVLIIICLITGFINAQRSDLNGQIIASDEVEGLHILNKTGLKYTISNEDGSFVIPAKVSDTIIVSGVKYQKQEIVISLSNINLGQFNVLLIEKVNELNEVVVGKILTGSLQSDLENLNIKPDINFYDLGIPGSTDLPATQNEQRLYDADHGKFVYYYGIGLSINVHKILNRINGDTKEYKVRVLMESNEACISFLQSEYSSTIFEAISIPEKHKNEFFQYCLEDIQFSVICEDENKINKVHFLLEKLNMFKIQLDEGN
ncbi:carboxypeptidase-like regulatory domain-containing protein [Winogradskyella undariae]|uniref:carboxypeptidase-like regulatory domain-containing protein n=1 Tax=Winogradskyella undariae TaxID=1285465 RepID=UPI00156B3C6C|nr:carboxypeptidase-like regulatory domain-containing protein [Winogradskyella undariae]NRR91116.1 carboxypeptidase-like regulatory domain-containing protein [Winogradskyella undariae]